jgi:O-antigen/teichoic acid export membrane protein
MTSQTRSRVAANAAAGTASQIVTIAIGLFTTPLILARLGRLDYGAFALIGSLSAYFGILDFGIGGGLTRFMSYHHERGDRQKIATFAVFGLVFYLTLGALLVPFLLAIAPGLGRFLRLPADLQAQFPGLLMAVLGLFVGWSLAGIIGARLTAAHRLDLAAYANVVGSVGFALLVFILLPSMPTVGGVFVCMGGHLLLVIATLWVSNRRVNGALVTWPIHWKWDDTRELFVFGLWTQVSSITAIVNLEADKAIISRSVGVASVTPYQVANRLALLSRALPLQLLSSLLPEVTARVSQGIERADIAVLYQRTSRHLMIPTLLIAGFVAGAAEPLLRLWLGDHIEGAAGLCTALVVSYAINNVTGVGTTVLRAQGQPQLETFYGILSAGLNVGLTIALIGPYGLDGVVMGTIAGNVIGSGVFIVLFHRREDIPWWPTIGHWLIRLVAVIALAAGAVHLLTDAITRDTTGRLALLPPIIAAGLVYLLLVLVLGWATRLWNDEDRMLLDRIVNILRRRRAV